MPDRLAMLRSAFERESAMRPVSGSPNALPRCGVSARVSASARADAPQGAMHTPAPVTKAIAVRPRFEMEERLSLGYSRWLRHHVEQRCKPNTQRSYRDALAKLEQLIGDRVVDDITQDEVLAAIEQIKACSRATYWTAWAACFNWLGRYDITRGVKRWKSRYRKAVLSTDDLPHWLAALGMAIDRGWIRHQCLDVLLLLTLTSMRKGEVLGLRWEYCDLGNEVLALPEELSKTGERSVFLGKLGASLIAGQPRRTEYVFASRMKGASLPHLTPQAVNNGMRKVLVRYAEETGYRFPPKLVPHSLRHTFASHAAASGVSSEHIRMMGGWSSEWMRQRYSHLLTDVKADVDRVQGRLVAGLRVQMNIATT